MLGNYAIAQNAALVNKVDTLINKRVKNIYVEIMGAGLAFSANYDTRFENKEDGIGARIGVGGYSIDASSILAVPVQLNYLVGKKNKFLELGLGFTYFNFSGSDLIFFKGSKVNTSKEIGTLTFGYRYQPKEGGFSYRTFISPFFDGKTFIPYWFGASMGYSF